MSARGVRRKADQDDSPRTQRPVKRTRKVDNFEYLDTCQKLFDAIRSAQDEDGHLFSESFVKAPSRRSDPEYYKVVEKPIDLQRIQQKLKAEEYRSFTEFCKDLELLIGNAKAAYKEDSDEYKDIDAISDIYDSERERLTDLKPSTSNATSASPAPSAADGSTAAAIEEWRLESVLGSLLELADNDGRLICPPFRVLAPPEVFPLYYEHIKEPIDLKTIATKLRDGQYTSRDLFEADMKLLFKNARNFNEPGSQIYKDTGRLQAHFKQKMDEFTDCRKPSQKELARYRKEVDDLLKQVGTGLEEFSEDSEEDEDSEADNDPKWVMYWKVRNFGNVHGEPTCEPFMSLPDSTQYPDYYEDIAEPISLYMINKRLKRGDYKSLEELVKDFQLMFANAREYNIEGSVIYEKAVKLEKYVLETAKSLQPGMKIESDLNVAESPKQNGVERSPRKSKPKLTSVQSFTDDDTASEASSTPASRPRSSKKRKDPSLPRMKPGRKTHEELRQRYDQTLMRVVNVIRETVVGGRTLAEPFEYLPCEKTYNDYYETISKPVAIATILEKIESRMYPTSNDFIADIRLMFNNAREYNLPGSQIVNDATMLEGIAVAEMKNITEGKLLILPPQGRYEGKSRYIPKTEGVSPSPAPASRTPMKVTTRTPKTVKIEDLPHSSNHADSSHSWTNDMPAADFRTASQRPNRSLPREQQQMYSIFEALCMYRDQDERVLSTPFMRLPLRAEYPDYYNVIKRPIDLEKVKQKLNASQYDSLKAMVSDLNLVFDNACKFNEPDSQLYKDALTLQKELLELRSEFDDESIPSVQSQVKRILTNLFVHITTHKDSSGHCPSNSLVDLHDKLRKLGVKDAEFPFSFDDIKNNLDLNRYKRLDRFQEDVFALFSKAREISPVDSQTFQDACDLQVEFIRKREELCKDVLVSTARLHNESFFNEELTKQKKAKRAEEKAQEEADGAETTPARSAPGGDASAPSSSTTTPEKPSSAEKSISEGTEQLETFEIDGVTYCPEDYVYVASADDDAPPDAPRHIMRLKAILKNKEDGTHLVKGIWCYRPSETFHLATRKFYPKEVFLTPFEDDVTVERLRGKCCVMYADDYLRSKPKAFAEDDVFVCESRYLGRQRHFKPLKSWPYPEEQEKLELEERPEPLNPVKIISEFVANRKDRRDKEGSQVPEVATSSDDSRPRVLPDVLDMHREDVPDKRSNDDGEKAADGNIYYQQVQHNGRYYLLGDGVLVFNEEKGHCDVMRIDKMWKDTDGKKFFSGAFFARPKEVRHEESRMFFKKEVIAVDKPDCTVPMEKVQARCAILIPKEFETKRPTEIPECDVFVVESRVYGTTDGPCKSSSLYRGGVKGDDPEAEMFVPPDEIMNMTNARRLNGLKKYKLSQDVVEDEIYQFKQPLTMEKELSPLVMKTDNSLPIDPMDIEKEERHVEEQLDGGKATKDNAWLLSQPKLNAKSKSGYILFSAEIRKRIMNENPEAGFGEVSRIVGVEWKKLTEEQKRQYEVRAQYIADERAKAELLTPSSKVLEPGQVRVYTCRWQMCDYQFDSQDGLYEHIKTSHTCQPDCKVLMDGTDHYACTWTSCLKYRKEGKPFPSLPRLHRHIKERHLLSAAKAIFPNQKSKHFFEYIPLPQNGTAAHSNSHSASKDKSIAGHFLHKPNGHTLPNAVPCTVATLTPAPTPVSARNATPSTSIANSGTPLRAVAPHPGPPGSTPSTSSAHPQGTPVGVATTPGHYVIHQPGGGQVQQLVQATINGTTVYVPANQQYQTVIVNQVPHGQPGGPHQIVVHHGQPASSSAASHPPGTVVASGAPSMVGAQHVYVHTGAPGTAAGTQGHLVNGVTPGTAYASHPAPGPIHSSTSVQQQHHPQVVHVQQTSGGMTQYVQASSSAATQPMIDAGRTIVQAPPKPPEPVFVPPPNSVPIKRAMHSETYLRYIESLSNAKQRSVSKWDRNLSANHKNTPINSKRAAGPYEWIRENANGSKPREDEVVKALWKLRDQLLESTVGIARDGELRQ